MEEPETFEPIRPEVANGGNRPTAGHETRKAAVRAAAIAAASGATAFAAKKAFSGRGSSSDSDEATDLKPARTSDETLTSALSSSLETALGSILPVLEDAATQAGEYVARNAPVIVSEKLVPKFIRGFERARKTSPDDGGDDK